MKLFMTVAHMYRERERTSQLIEWGHRHLKESEGNEVMLLEELGVRCWHITIYRSPGYLRLTTCLCIWLSYIRSYQSAAWQYSQMLAGPTINPSTQERQDEWLHVPGQRAVEWASEPLSQKNKIEVKQDKKKVCTVVNLEVLIKFVSKIRKRTTHL